jgi:hypothetical protein
MTDKPDIRESQVESQIDTLEEDMRMWAEEYIARLPEGSSPKNRLCFQGLLMHIHRRMFRPKRLEYSREYGIHNTTIDTRDILGLYRIYDVYRSLCSEYQQECLQAGFLNLTGISKDIFNQWSRGQSIPCKDPNLKHFWTDFTQLVNSNSEASLSTSMLQGNFMAYATLKCWYGWREDGQATITQQSETPTLLSRDDLEALADSASGLGIPELDQIPEPSEIG